MSKNIFAIAFSWHIDRRVPKVLSILLLITISMVAIAILKGEYAIPPLEAFKTAFGLDRSNRDYTFVIHTLRLPRTVVAYLVGVGLAISGTILQGLTRNSLADPSIVGIDAGASLAAVTLIIIFPGVPLFVLPLSAFVGALTVALVIYLFAWKQGSSLLRFILIGIGLAAIASALTSLMLTFGAIQDVSQALIWLTGSVSSRSWEYVWLLLPWLVVLVPLSLGLAIELNALNLGDDYGSNAWAIAPENSESGNAILLANPHLPWSDLFLWYEAQIVAPGIDAYGATLVGIPVLAIAFNDSLGWTHTVNTYDGWDAYELTLVDGGYRFDDNVSAFQTQEQILKVKQNDDSLRQEKLLVRQSIHGPIVAEKEGKAIALRVAGLDRSGVLEQWWDMARATNFTQFEAVLKRLQLPMFTVMYADRDGHILHLFNGQVPIRDRGDFEYWQRIIPGDNSATLWTKTHPYQDLPRVLDPKSGWLQNANDPPWTTTFPLAIDPDDYPAYMAPRNFMGFRSQRSARMLAEDEKISFAETIAYKHSTRMELADRILDDLIDAARRSDKAIVRQALSVLQSWDRQADADSQGAVLFDFWTQEMDFPDSFAIPWRENAPRVTPDGLKDPQQAVTALETASTKVKAAYGKLDIKWGEVFRLRYGTVDLPANGGFGDLGIFRVVNFEPGDNGQFYSVDGDSYIAAIEFSHPVKAMVLTGV
jgi:acyl-homoserine lactone acylase PvdQ